MIFKNLADQCWSDTIFSDEDWTRTEKFHSPLIFDSQSFPSLIQSFSNFFVPSLPYHSQQIIVDTQSLMKQTPSSMFKKNS